eukprot:5298263-Prymnesium_polylepis.2
MWPCQAAAPHQGLQGASRCPPGLTASEQTPLLPWHRSMLAPAYGSPGHIAGHGVNTLPFDRSGECTGAVHLLVHAVRPASLHVKAAVAHRALDEQPGIVVDDEWPQKEDVEYRRSRGRNGARQLEIARTREHNTALHHVIGDKGLQSARCGSDEDVFTIWIQQMPLCERMRWLMPPEGAPPHASWWRNVTVLTMSSLASM